MLVFFDELNVSTQLEMSWSWSKDKDIFVSLGENILSIIESGSHTNSQWQMNLLLLAGPSHPTPSWKLDGGCFPYWSVAKCIFQGFYLGRSRTRGCLTPLVLITVQPPWQLLCVRTSHRPLTPHYPKFILLKHHNEGFTGTIAGFI